MQKEFTIFHNEIIVGQARVTKEGLYYRFSCRCILLDKAFHRLYLIHSGGMHALGLLVPEADHFTLNKRIPVKRIGAGEWRLVVDATPKRKNIEPLWIREDQPCLILPQLQNACFVLHDNRPCIVLKDRSAVQQDSGQNP